MNDMFGQAKGPARATLDKFPRSPRQQRVASAAGWVTAKAMIVSNYVGYRTRQMLRASTFILILSTVLQARSVPGSLRGRVTDGSGAAVSAVVVAAITGQGRVKVGITDAQGHYAIGDLSPGRYTIWAGSNGFSLYENTSLGVTAGRTQTLDICLRPSLQGSSAARLEIAEVRVCPDRAPVLIRLGTGRKPVAFATLVSLVSPWLLSLVGLLA